MSSVAFGPICATVLGTRLSKPEHVFDNVPRFCLAGGYVQRTSRHGCFAPLRAHLRSSWISVSPHSRAAWPRCGVTHRPASRRSKSPGISPPGVRDEGERTSEVDEAI